MIVSEKNNYYFETVVKKLIWWSPDCCFCRKYLQKVKSKLVLSTNFVNTISFLQTEAPEYEECEN